MHKLLNNKKNDATLYQVMFTNHFLKDRITFIVLVISVHGLSYGLQSIKLEQKTKFFFVKKAKVSNYLYAKKFFF